MRSHLGDSMTCLRHPKGFYCDECASRASTLENLKSLQRWVFEDMSGPDVHALWGGQALCGFTSKTPNEWPPGHSWVRPEELGLITCVFCQVAARCSHTTPDEWVGKAARFLEVCLRRQSPLLPNETVKVMVEIIHQLNREAADLREGRTGPSLQEQIPIRVEAIPPPEEGRERIHFDGPVFGMAGCPHGNDPRECQECRKES